MLSPLDHRNALVDRSTWYMPAQKIACIIILGSLHITCVQEPRLFSACGLANPAARHIIIIDDRNAAYDSAHQAIVEIIGIAPTTCIPV